MILLEILFLYIPNSSTFKALGYLPFLLVNPRELASTLESSFYLTLVKAYFKLVIL